MEFARLVKLLRLLVLLFAALALPAAAQAKCDDARDSKRVALVVGNGTYLPGQWANLPNARSDAQAVCDGFAGQGFRVIKVENADRDAMGAAIAEFAKLAPKADIALFYFAGHGFEYAGVNWLVPVDAPVETARGWLKGQFVDLATVLAAVKQAKNGLVFLDACRTRDPIVRIKDADPDGPDGPAGTINLPGDFEGVVFYSTARGASAFDAAPVNSPNSPFAQAVVDRLAIPDLELMRYFSFVRADVKRRTTEQTGGPQIPITYGFLSNELYFNQPPAASGGLDVPDPAPAATPTSGAVVVRSSGPDAAAFPVGKHFQPDSKIVLKAGSSVTIIDAYGTRIIKGPGTFSVTQSVASRMEGQAAYVTNTTRRVRAGAVRDSAPGATGMAPPPEIIAPPMPGSQVPTLTRKFAGLDPGKARDALAAIDKHTLATEDEPQVIARVLGQADAGSVAALANAGDPTAQYLYGAMLYLGIGVERDLPAARAILEKAAAGGGGAGLLEYGYFLENYGDRPADKALAAEVFEKAAQTGYPKAQAHMAFRLWEGKNAAVDKARATTLWQGAAAQGYPYAWYALGVYAGQMKDASQHLGEYAAKGDRGSDGWLCELAEYRGEAGAAFDHCLKAAQDGIPGSMAVLARLYAEGDGVTLSKREALYWAKLALAQPDYTDTYRRPLTEALAASLKDAR